VVRGESGPFEQRNWTLRIAESQAHGLVQVGRRCHLLIDSSECVVEIRAKQPVKYATREVPADRDCETGAGEKSARGVDGRPVALGLNDQFDQLGGLAVSETPAGESESAIALGPTAFTRVDAEAFGAQLDEHASVSLVGLDSLVAAATQMHFDLAGGARAGPEWILRVEAATRPVVDDRVARHGQPPKIASVS
jgi:hypothetical protein